MTRPETNREAVARAYHEYWCGSPPSCGVSSYTATPCEGKMKKPVLDAVVAALDGPRRT